MALDWKRSSKCGNTTCVEVAEGPYGTVLIRDGKNPTQEPLVFDGKDWAAFLDEIGEGRVR